MKQHSLFILILFAWVSVLCSCQKEISFDNTGVTDSIPGNGPGTTPSAIGLNKWQFTDHTSGTFHSGTIDTAKTLFDVKPIWNYLKITGWPGNSSPLNKDTIFVITMYLPNPVIDTGNYQITSGIGGDHFLGYANNNLLPPYGSNQQFCYYIATPPIAPGFLLRIDSYNSQQRILKGSFSGNLRRKATITDLNTTTNFISGSFYLQLN